MLRRLESPSTRRSKPKHSVMKVMILMKSIPIVRYMGTVTQPQSLRKAHVTFTNNHARFTKLDILKTKDQAFSARGVDGE